MGFFFITIKFIQNYAAGDGVCGYFRLFAKGKDVRGDDHHL